MDTSKIIKGVVNSGRYTVTAPIVKEDYGLYLQIEGIELPSTYEVDFSNSEHNGTSVTMIGNADGVLIPHQFIDTGKDIFAFLYHVGANYGRTVYKFRIPNKLRPDRTEETPTPEEQSVIDQTISALNEAVAQTAQDVASAGQSAQSAQGYAESAEGYAESASTSASNALASETNAERYADRAETAESHAQDYASQASGSASSADDSAETAEAYATGKRDGVDVGSSDPAYHNNSKYYSEQASASATTASTKAGEASESASTASSKATEASGYASTASTKASEANTSAQTASQKATESAQSASQAFTYKTDAESAKTASQTAQGLAESARDSAVQAKTDAESARDEAQNLVDGISGKVEQIDANTASIASLEEDRYKPYVTDSASGAIASFPDGADDIPLKSLVVNIDPVQDLHGQDSPYPAGGGKNLCSDIASDYTKPFNYWVWHRTLEDGTYYITVTAKSGAETGYAFIVGKSGDAYSEFVDVVTVLTTAGTTYNRSFTVDSTWTNPVIGIYCPNGKTVSDFFANYTVQLEKNATATSYAPYENICPISGWTEINVNHSDADMTNPTTVTIDLGQTVYGGKLDVLSGELTVDRAMVDLGTFNWSYRNSNNRSIFETAITDRAYTLDNNKPINAVCTRYKPVSYNATWVNGNIASNGSGTTWISIVDNNYSDATTFKTAMSGVMLCYELATPITIQLTPNQINSIYGVNNMWADSGDTTAEYRADTKLFIERLTAPDSADMIADANITSGQYFMVGNSLYKATANIANGSAIIVGTNCIRKSLSEALNEINA